MLQGAPSTKPRENLSMPRGKKSAASTPPAAAMVELSKELWEAAVKPLRPAREMVISQGGVPEPSAVEE